MLTFLKKIKSTSIYFLFLKYLFIPIYSFFWHYILHFYSKIISKIYLFKKNESYFIKLKYNTKILINENKDFYILADKISKVITPELLNDLKKKFHLKILKKRFIIKLKMKQSLKVFFL